MSQNTAQTIVRFQAVDIQYAQHTILAQVHFSIQRGEFVYIVGKTGAGKSSLMRLLYADLKPSHGSVTVDQFIIEQIKEAEIPFLRRKLGIIFQDFQLLPDRSVSENIRFALKSTGWNDAKLIKTQLNEVLMKVGLSNKMDMMPHQLSGGEKQRLCIARALINDPVLILADEPTGNLDPEVSAHIMELLLKINRTGTAIIMATHDYSLINRYPGRILECANGKVTDI
jgi:cell division transport system ATP-binding protein